MDTSLLRATYPVFSYVSYAWEIRQNSLLANWDFRAGSENYRPHLTLNLPSAPRNLPESEIDTLVFNLGLAEIPSYWKATCSPKIEVLAGTLTSHQIAWWEKLIYKGMGQYFYENKIDLGGGQPFQITSSGKSHATLTLAPDDQALVLASGGKDTAVTLSLIGKNTSPVALAMNPSSATLSLLQESDITVSVVATRKLDPHLLNLNKQGFLNGHVPLSAYLAFLGILTAHLLGKKYLIVSNEASSEEGNLIYQGKPINHQYSKTFEFENDFRSYMSSYLNPSYEFFSFLRPLLEIQILGIFSRHKNLFPLFRSCNVGEKSGVWCGKCPKCLSTFILIVPFVGLEQAVKIFSQDLYQNSSILPIFEDLVGLGTQKPFECVGTVDEMRLAARYAMDLYPSSSLPPLLVRFGGSIPFSPEDYARLTRSLLSNFGPHNLPSSYHSLLKQELPVKFK